MKCPRCQQDNAAHAKFCLECGTPLTRSVESGEPASSYSDLRRALTEALDQQTATSQILRAISSSTDLQTVLDTVAESAARVCGATDAHIYRLDGEILRFAASYGSIGSTALARERGVPATRETVTGRSVVDRRSVHVHDLAAQLDDFPASRPYQERLGFRSTLATPLLHEGAPLGAILIRRMEVRPFSEDQIKLLETFANQAAIAIENVRLFKEVQAKNAELTEALDQQTATAEILGVISQSPTNVQPVFDAIVASAVRLLQGTGGSLLRIVGDKIELAALTSTDADGDAAVKATYPRSLHSDQPLTRAIRDRVPFNIVDAQSDPRLPEPGRAFARLRGYRSLIIMPLIGRDEALGAMTVSRRESGGFTEDEVALLKTFADQAVIAIENVRLFKELEARNRDLTTALDQQTATSDILKVISSSPTDVQPVFDAIVRAAVQLCHAVQSNVQLFDGQLMHFVAQHNIGPAAMEMIQRLYPMAPHRSQTASRAVLDRAVVHVPNVLEDPDYLRELALEGGWRSVLSVPMIGKGQPIGAITVTRMEPGWFSKTEIALLQTFAEQAVIAIENVRLFTELQEKNQALTQAHAQVTEALDQQTATSEILRVIARSPTNLQPVLDELIENAGRLCQSAETALLLIQGDQLRVVAASGYAEADATGLSHPIHRGWVAGRAVVDARTVHVDDLGNAEDEFPLGREIAIRFGHRTALAIPLLREGIAIGALFLRRRQVRPFADKEITLLQTFADQAVIAIENVRLFNETKEALERQTATGEILRIIARSPADIRPVLETIVEHAGRVCGAFDAIVFLVEGDELVRAAHRGPVPIAEGSLSLPIARDSISGVAVLDCRTVHVEDLLASQAFPPGRAFAERSGFRTAVSVPLVKEGVAIGTLVVRRTEVQGFSVEQIALLETFADQAVIAIENVRLFKELETRNRELTEALERQTATSSILEVISRSQTDVQAVFDAIVRSAVTLTAADLGAVLRTDGRQFFLAALYGVGDLDRLKAVERMHPRPVDPSSLGGRAILTGTIQQVEDVEASPSLPDRSLNIARAAGFRSNLVVPMLRGAEALGVISVARRHPGPFSEAQTELLKIFADQAVIAIENARLFNELQARTAELTRSVDKLTALGDVGRAVSSTLDLATVLTTIVSRAVELSGLDGGVVFEYDDGAEEFIHRVATEVGGALAQARRTARVRKGEGVVGQTALTLEPAQVPDITVPGAYESRLRENLIESGVRAILAVPMVREGEVIGCLVVSRNRSGEFPTETIELLRTFATQSALAIQNARLFREIEQKSRELEAASRHKSEFLANMSHELRTPLNAIIGFSEVLSERMFGELNAKQDEYLKDIHASGQHLLSLINDILDLSKIEAGKMELELSDFDMPMTIDNALMLVRERATRRSIELHTTVDERLGHIQADERKIRQVLLNLLSNAIKFTPEGGRIEVGAKPVNRSIEVSVSDTGVGIAPEDQEAVFEEFRQVGTADKKVEGTGLGLALSRKFIELHGGRIWVQSQVGAGLTFTFTIPIRTGA